MNILTKDLFPFESRWIEVGGNSIHYVDEGQGETILFCHPSIATSFMYRHLIKLLSPSYRCIALDFPGFGCSTAGPEYTYSIQSQSDIARQFIEKLELNALYPVIQEIGGHAAIIALLSTPQKVKGFIITDTIIFPVTEYKKISSMLEFINGKIFNFFNENFNLLIRASYRFGIRNRRLSTEEREVYKKVFNTKKKRRLITHMLYALKREESLMLKIRHSFETTFNKKPVLLIYGSKDPVHELGISQRIKHMLPFSELYLIEGEAHFPHEGAPERMAILMKQWIERQKSEF